MLSVYLKEPKNVFIHSIEEPMRKENQVLLEIKSVGICGSDIGAYRGTNPLVSYPRVLGHEIGAKVLEISENNPAGIRVGDHVVVDPYVYCGKCYPCSIGRTNCCTSLEVLGVHRDGGMVEYFTHPDHLVVNVPKDMPWHHVPLAEPLSISLHGIHRGALTKGEHIAISGAGAIGLMAALVALHYEAIPIVIDPLESRREFAKSLGIPYTLDTDDNLEKSIRDITDGRMAEVVMEASGAASAIRSTLDLVSHAGRIVLTGWPNQEIPLPTEVITRKELDVRGARTSVGNFEEAIDLIYRDILPVDSIITESVDIQEIPRMIKELDQHPEQYLKVIGIL